jgi:AraC-like DNA-binding protein
MPLTGHLESRGRHSAITSVAGQGTVFHADTPSLISHWDATCTVLGVKFDRTWLDREVERLLGNDRVMARTLLPNHLDLGAGKGKAWLRLVAGLGSHLRDPDLFIDSTLVRQQLAGAVAAGLVEACYPDRPGNPVRPTSVRRVVDQIHDNPARAWTAADMAALAGTSVRRLQETFHEYMGCTPTQYLLDVRLQRAHAELTADRLATVSDVAARWGFSSASRFAAAYKRRYGHSPAVARRNNV